MEEYVLSSDEVLLYEGTVIRNEQEDVNMKLTTVALVFSWDVTTGRFRKKVTEHFVNIIPLENIKIYNDAPQIKQTGSKVVIQTLFGDETVELEGFFKARTFAAKILEAITGTNTSQRGAKKVNSAISLVDDALGVDTVGTAKDIIENGIVGSVLGGLGKKREKTAKVVAAGNLLQESLRKPSESSEMTYDEKIEAVKKLKELLDVGILTQEEFDKKKKELLSL